jgi:hypothetical protein
MKRLGMLMIVLALTGAACDTDNGGTSPVSPSSVTTLVAQMSGAQNVPPAGSLEAGATGTVVISMVPASGGAYTAEIRFQLGGLVKAGLLPSPLDSGSVIVAGLIHQGAAGTLGPPIHQLAISTSAPLVSPTGTVAVTFSNVAIPAPVASAILSSPSSFYLNLYSALNQTGVLRGQLVKQ